MKIDFLELYLIEDEGIHAAIENVNKGIASHAARGERCVSITMIPASYGVGKRLYRRTIILGFEKKKSDSRIELEALISEREGMIALNQFRIGLGQGVAYDDAPFFENAEKIRAIGNGREK